VGYTLNTDVMAPTVPATRLGCLTWERGVIKVAAATLVLRDWLSGPAGAVFRKLRWKEPVFDTLAILATRWVEIAVTNPGGARIVVIDWALHTLRSIEALESFQDPVPGLHSAHAHGVKTSKLRGKFRDAAAALGIAWTDARLVQAITLQPTARTAAAAAESAFEPAAVSEARMQALIGSERYDDAINFAMFQGWRKQFVELSLKHRPSDAIGRLRQNANAILFSSGMLPKSDLCELVAAGAKVPAPVGAEARWRCVVEVALACVHAAELDSAGMRARATRIVDLLAQIAGSDLRLSARWKEFLIWASAQASVKATHTGLLVYGVQSAGAFGFAALVFNVLLVTNFSVDLFYNAWINKKVDDAGVAFAVPALLALYATPLLFVLVRLFVRCRCAARVPFSAGNVDTHTHTHTHAHTHTHTHTLTHTHTHTHRKPTDALSAPNVEVVQSIVARLIDPATVRIAVCFGGKPYQKNCVLSFQTAHGVSCACMMHL
jgi:hypothetical protein